MYNKTIRSFFAVFALGILGGSTAVASPDAKGTVRNLLSVSFETRPVDKIDVGDFHFLPGQLAPIHTHAAPALGYVSKGSIYYQVEGQKPVLLKQGDAFYEPVGPQILHFDNASKTEEAVFTDFNLQREAEPFIVLPKPLTAKIDRRSFPTTHLDGTTVNKVDIDSADLSPSEVAPTADGQTTLYYVAEGDISVQSKGANTIVYHTGATFVISRETTVTQIANASAKNSAKLVRFQLQNTGARQ